jgi:hypothetical protein
MRLHVLGPASLDQVFGGEIAEGWKRLRAVPGEGLLDRPGPRQNMVDDLDHVSQPFLGCI